MDLNLEKVNRAFIISDTHLGARTNSIEWLEVMKSWFYDDFIPKVKENYQPGDILIHCGDLFDNRQSVNLLVLHEGIRLFEEFSKIFVDGIYIIAGNHDVMRRTSNEVTSLDVLKYIPNVNIIKEPIVAKFSTTSALFMPWRSNNEEEKECIKSHSEYDCNYLFCHANIRNLRFDNSRQIEDGLDLAELEGFQKVYSGHIHWSQKRGNVTMIGNPYQMTRSDAGNEKSFYLIDFRNGKEIAFRNESSPKFIRLYLNRFLESPISELTDLCVNNRVDLYVPSNFLIKYQINPIIDILSVVAKKLDIIPYEDESNSNDDLFEEDGQSYNIYELCQKYVSRISTIDDSTKSKVIDKINKLYSNIIKESKE